MVPEFLRVAIELLHHGMREEQDPRNVQTLATCLRALTAMQASYMQGGGQQQPPPSSAGRNAVVAQLQGTATPALPPLNVLRPSSRG
jgi:hypothetical protein